jgi:lysozyme
MDCSLKLGFSVGFLLLNILAQVSFAEESTGSDAKSLGMVDLTDDLDRQQLFKEILLADPGRKKEYEGFALKKVFYFPKDVEYDEALKVERKNSIFGVDISHHNGDYPIEHLEESGVTFLLMKAGQGRKGLDPMFAKNWRRAGDLDGGVKLHRGAYFFLSSGETGDNPDELGKAQAESLVKIIKANGGLRSTDLAPSVDVEWDKYKSNVDRWGKWSPAEIAIIVKAFSKKVEDELGVKPIIYTAKSWWLERMKSEKTFSEFDGHVLWIADYSNSSQANEIPKTINGKKWAVWQFTDNAHFEIGHKKNFDANIFKGSPEEFRKALSVEEFK